MRKLLAITLFLLAAMTGSAATPHWESVAGHNGQTVTTTAADAPDRSTDGDLSDVAVKDGCIYVTCLRPTHVKVFTILGQLISQDTLQPGIHRLRISARGIYILKTADSTRRVTI